MYKKKILIRTQQDAKHELELLRSDVQSESLEKHVKEQILDQVETTFSQFEKQLSIGSTKKFIADRIFEGEGYQIILRVRSGNVSFLSKMKSVLGID